MSNYDSQDAKSTYNVIGGGRHRQILILLRLLMFLEEGLYIEEYLELVEEYECEAPVGAVAVWGWWARGHVGGSWRVLP